MPAGFLTAAAAAHHKEKEKENSSVDVVKKASATSTKPSKNPSFLDAMSPPSLLLRANPSRRAYLR